MSERKSQERPFTTTSSRIAWSCPWYDIRQDEFRMADGQSGQYNVVQKEPAVWIVPVTSDGHVVLINHYRYTVDDWCWEVPAGSVKPGQSLQEAAEEELSEEIGGQAASWKYIGRFYPANGICNEVGHIFLAVGVELGDAHREPEEVIEVHKKSISETLSMAQGGEIDDGPSALAVLLCAGDLMGIAGE